MTQTRIKCFKITEEKFDTYSKRTSFESFKKCCKWGWGSGQGEPAGELEGI